MKFVESLVPSLVDVSEVLNCHVVAPVIKGKKYLPAMYTAGDRKGTCCRPCDQREGERDLQILCNL